ncbi:hypothetical protein [Streptomyces sp. H39-C1]|uniref:hypothetical protein n=1 Tax=Streptomyces sp. H39-C1 TaxID=3004355 RepID=UPI0022AE8521|nr:hypothetical protein [Streptomyces sp. H39-C1]MCZ4099887.1 hypothetical protein [Streptomyces sp. H39-C1]
MTDAPAWIHKGAFVRDRTVGVEGEITQIGSGYNCVDPQASYVWLRPVGGGLEHLAQIDDLEQARP